MSERLCLTDRQAYVNSPLFRFYGTILTKETTTENTPVYRYTVTRLLTNTAIIWD